MNGSYAVNGIIISIKSYPAKPNGFVKTEVLLTVKEEGHHADFKYGVKKYLIQFTGKQKDYPKDFGPGQHVLIRFRINTTSPTQQYTVTNLVGYSITAYEPQAYLTTPQNND